MTQQTDLSQVLSLPGRSSVATQELVFLASQLQPLGLTTFLLHREEQVEDGDDKSVEGKEEEARWLMGKEGGLRLEASPSSSEIRLIDPSRGIDIEVISPCKEITHGDPMLQFVCCVWLQQVVKPAFYCDHFFFTIY